MNQISETISLLARFKRKNEEILSNVKHVHESTTFDVLLESMKEIVACKGAYEIVRSCYFDELFNAEIDVPRDQIFLLQKKQRFTFYVKLTDIKEV